MGAVLQLRNKQYELLYQQYYAKGKLNLKLDEISKADAEKYITKIKHRQHMKNVLKAI